MSNTNLEDARIVLLHSPTTPLENLVGLAELAEAGGVTYSTISAYRTRGRLPEPAAMIGRTPVWTRRQMQRWLQGRKANAGA